MVICAGWLAADFLARKGWQITAAADGTRTAVRPANPGLVLDVPRACDHADCPPRHGEPEPQMVADDLIGMPW